MAINTSGFDKKMKKLLDIKKNVMPLAFKEFVDATPIKTGNARRNTKLINYIITAKYPYSKVLDDGRTSGKKSSGSNQAPQGMVRPTAARIPLMIKNYVRTI